VVVQQPPRVIVREVVPAPVHYAPPPAPVYVQGPACAGLSNEIVGMIGGAAAGGLLGAQVGKGTGKLAATAGGTLGGALLGASFGRTLDRANGC